MGNRAVITTQEEKIGIYLHWNGGRDSVEAFLKYCELRNFPSPEEDCYGWARLCQVIGNYFGGSISIGMNLVERLDCDNGDNGTYIIEKWRIVGRKFLKGSEQNHYDLLEFLKAINEKQPKEDQLAEGVMKDEVKYIIEEVVAELAIGEQEMLCAGS